MSGFRAVLRRKRAVMDCEHGLSKSWSAPLRALVCAAVITAGA
jgi:hypothetical protein